jgi:hypothetical protein
MPITLLLLLIKHVCNFDLLRHSPHDSGHDSESITRPILLKPPSLRGQNSTQTQEGIKWTLASMPPQVVDLSRGTHEILLTWLPKVTQFSSDFRVYIWENHKSLPTLEYAKIALRSSRPDLEPDQMIVAFRSCSTNVAFKQKRNSPSLQTDLGPSQTIGHQQWLRSCECFLSLQCVFELIIDDVTNFINMYQAEIYQMVSSIFRTHSSFSLTDFGRINLAARAPLQAK